MAPPLKGLAKELRDATRYHFPYEEGETEEGTCQNRNRAEAFYPMDLPIWERLSLYWPEHLPAEPGILDEWELNPLESQVLGRMKLVVHGQLEARVGGGSVWRWRNWTTELITPCTGKSRGRYSLVNDLPAPSAHQRLQLASSPRCWAG